MRKNPLFERSHSRVWTATYGLEVCGSGLAASASMEHQIESLAGDAQKERMPVSSAATLARWSDYSWQEFVSVNQLAPFDRIVVTTRNHVYEIVVTSPDNGEVLVRGGAFPTFVLATIIGSRGHGAIELGAVAVGLRLEFELHAGPWIVTSPIEAVAVVPAGAIHRDAVAS